MSYKFQAGLFFHNVSLFLGSKTTLRDGYHKKKFEKKQSHHIFLLVFLYMFAHKSRKIQIGVISLVWGTEILYKLPIFTTVLLFQYGIKSLYGIELLLLFVVYTSTLYRPCYCKHHPTTPTPTILHYRP